MGKGFTIYAITFFALSIVLIIFCIIGKHALDLYPIFGLLWAAYCVFLVRHLSSIKRLAGFLGGFILFTGWIDGFAHHQEGVCGAITWIHPPWAIPWDFLGDYPYGSPLTNAYLFILWAILNPMVFIAVAYYFVELFTARTVNKYFTPAVKFQNILLILMGIMFLVTFSISDYFNFLLRGYIPMVGLFPDIPWVYEVSVLHLIIMVSAAIVIFILTFTAQLGRGSNRIRTYIIILVLFIIFLIMRIGIPYFYLLFTGSTEVSIAFVVGLIILIGVVAIGFAAGMYYIGLMRPYRGTIVRF